MAPAPPVTLLALIRGEFLEHPVLLFWAPVAVLGAIAFIFVAVVVGTWLADSPPVRVEAGSGGTDLAWVIAALTFWYLVRAGPARHRHPSAPTVQAPPASDLQATLAMLVTGAVLLPGVWLLLGLVFLVPAGLVGGTVWAPMLGLTWNEFFAGVDFGEFGAGVALGFAVSVLWALPVWSWALLASAAPHRPLLVALAPLGVALLFDGTRALLLAPLSVATATQAPLTRALLERVFDTPMSADRPLAASLDLLRDPGLYAGIAVAVAICAGAILARRRTASL